MLPACALRSVSRPPMPAANSNRKNPLPGLLLIFAVLAGGIIAAGIGYHCTPVAQLRSKAAREGGTAFPRADGGQAEYEARPIAV